MTHPSDPDPVRDALTRARSDVFGTNTSTSRSTKDMTTTSASKTNTHGGSRTRKQTLVPKLESKLVTTSIQFYSNDELVMETAAFIARLPAGHALVYRSGQGVYSVVFPLAKHPYRRAVQFAQKQLAVLRTEQHLLPFYSTPERILSDRSKVIHATIQELDRIALENEDALALPSPTPPAPRLAPNNQDTIIHSATPLAITAHDVEQEEEDWFV